jgi:hypothetical protein
MKDGGPAFPRVGQVEYNSQAQNGMSLRDWLAGQAVRGLLSNSNFAEVEVVHVAAYAIADRMLRERNKSGDEPA